MMGTTVDSTNPYQLGVLFRFVDDTSLIQISWNGMIFVRREFLVDNSFPSNSFSAFSHELKTKIIDQGLRSELT